MKNSKYLIFIYYLLQHLLVNIFYQWYNVFRIEYMIAEETIGCLDCVSNNVY